MEDIVANVSMLALLGLGGGEVLLILALVLMLFGPRLLSNLVRGRPRGFYEEILKAFRELLKGIDQNASDAGRSVGGIYGKPVAEALTPDNQVAELYEPAAFGKKGSVFRRRSKGIFAAIAIGIAVAILLIAVILLLTKSGSTGR